MPADVGVCQPLLTIAIPTYNRAGFLQELLESLLPQVSEVAGSEVEVIISDNASTDSTAETVEELTERAGAKVRLLQQPANLGPDGNFLACWEAATGLYFWLLGDDDILRPGALHCILQHLRQRRYDIVFLAPQAFYRDWKAEFTPDPWGREAQVITSAREMALVMNVGITFITGYVINRERLLQVADEPPASFLGTNLVQLSWSLPLLRYHRKSLVLWQRFLMGRAMNSGGYNVADVFGARFLEVAHRLLPDRPEITAIFSNFALRRWFPGMFVDLRLGDNTRYKTTDAETTLRKLFGRNFRYWFFTWPTLVWPLSMAVLWRKGTDLINRAWDLLQMPSHSLYKLQSRFGRRRQML